MLFLRNCTLTHSNFEFVLPIEALAQFVFKLRQVSCKKITNFQFVDFYCLKPASSVIVLSFENNLMSSWLILLHYEVFKVLSHRPHFSTKQGVRRSVIRNFYTILLFHNVVNIFLYFFNLIKFFIKLSYFYVTVWK